MKRTNVVIDEKKIRDLKRAFDLDTTKEVIDLALTELLKSHRRKGILALKGKVRLDLDLNQTRKLG